MTLQKEKKKEKSGFFTEALDWSLWSAGYFLCSAFYFAQGTHSDAEKHKQMFYGMHRSFV